MTDFSNDNALIHADAMTAAAEIRDNAVRHLRQTSPSASVQDYQPLLVAHVQAAALLEASIFLSRSLDNLAAALRDK